MELTRLPEAETSPDGSAYAEFLSAGRASGARRALAGIVCQTCAVLEDLPLSPQPRDGREHVGVPRDRELHEILGRLRQAAATGIAWDAVNDDPRDYDPTAEEDGRFAFLADEAMPLADQDNLARGAPGAAIIGIIDDSFPFAHQLLSVGGGDVPRHSRVASVWMQGARSLTPAPDARPADSVDPALLAALGFDRAPPPVGADLIMGRELRGGQIDTLLSALGTPRLPDEGALYRAAGAIDMRRQSPPAWAREGSHGAAVALCAAAFAPCDPEARQFPVIAVCLPPEVTRDSSGSLGPVFIILAYLHILHRAARLCRVIEDRRGLPRGTLRLPMVINLSYGITAGPKDGQSLLERFQDALDEHARDLGLGPVRCVLPAGNHRQAQLHARLRIPQGTHSETLRWSVPADDASPNALEVWGPPEPTSGPRPPRLDVAIRPPGAAEFTQAQFDGDGWFALSAEGAEIARVRRVRHVTPGRARDCVTVIVHPTVPRRLDDPVAPPGEWHLRVSGPSHGPVDATVQRDENIAGYRSGARQSILVDERYEKRRLDGRSVADDPARPLSPIRRRGTLNAYATGRKVLRVGGAVRDQDGSALTSRPVPGDVTAEAVAGAGAVYSGIDEDGLGGSPAAGATLDEVPSDARWAAACERSDVREGLIVAGIGSGSRQVLRGTSLAAPRVTRFVATRLARGI